MKILLCTVPDGSLEEIMKPARPTENGFMQTCIGCLRVASWMEKNDYPSVIYDINNLRPTDEELIKEFNEIKPDVVGLSAPLSHCYPSVIRITNILRKLFPDIWIVVGGAITASSHILLRRTETDICVVGDGEISFVKLLDYIKSNLDRKNLDYKKLSQITGLTYLENNELKFTGYGEQLTESELEYPDYEKQRQALRGKEEWIWHLFKPLKTDPALCNLVNKLPPETKKLWEKNKDKNLAYVPTSLGCVAKCTFCQRYTKGYRIYKTKGLETYLRELKEKFNIGAVEIWDENFGSNKTQGYEIARIMKKLNLLWKAPAIRVRSVTYEDLIFYRDHNLMSLKFGIEAGSQTILDIMEKKNTVDDNYKTIVNCKKAGVQTPNPGGIILGMPGETTKTVEALAENMAKLRFAAGVHSGLYGAFWAWPVPGTPLYEYCQQIGVIGKTMDEEEEYLIRSSNTKVDFLNHINTSNNSVKEIFYWSILFQFVQKIGFRNEILKSELSIKEKIKELYTKCVKLELNSIVRNTKKIFSGKHILKLRTSPVSVRTYQTGDRTLYKRIRSFLALLYKNSLLIGALFLPRSVVYFFVRIYSHILFNNFEYKFRVKDGKQKYNVFSSPKPDLSNKYRVNDIQLEELAEPDRKYSAKRSLRQLVALNREKMNPPETEEEKGMALLARGQ